MNYFDKPNPSSTVCPWCGNEVNPSMLTRWDKAPWIGDRVTHFSCIEAIERSARTLVSNLVIGAALCRAYRDGYRIGGANPLDVEWWKPGCGRSAP